MKKIIALAFGVALSGVAMAQTTELARSGPVIMADCPPLNEDVQINLTNGVLGAVACDATRVAIATCHQNGLTKSRSVEVFNEADPDNIVSFDPRQFNVTEGAQMATATTVQGTVLPIVQDGANCNQAGVTGVAEGRLP